MNILDSMKAYETFLGEALGRELVEDGLRAKREKMKDSPFAFLRATYWRWAETIPDLPGEPAGTPRVLAVGDIHLENFGTWRDAEGRLVWGVNDYDEAAEMPYVLDLLRLATSARLARGETKTPATATIAEAILAGYADGLRTPGPCVLDRDKALGNLRNAVAVPEGEREKFWNGLEKKQNEFRKPGTGHPTLWPRYRDALLAALPPGAGAEESDMWYREAGLGSLGRPRWVVQAQWRGDAVVREAKGVVLSAWTWVRKDQGPAPRCLEIATGRHRAPDPWYRVADGIAVRLLSPNNRKIETDKPLGEDNKNGTEKTLGKDVLLSSWMLTLMGRELAAVHLGTGGEGQDTGKRIRENLDQRERENKDWLARRTEQAARSVLDDYAAILKG